ncbi:MAG: amidohydrolase [Isosphaeraceae bacterium]
MNHRLLVLLSVLATIAPAALFAGPAEKDDDWFGQRLGSLVTLYQDLHAHPELSFQERNTAKRVADELRAAGAEVTEGVGGFGVVGILRNGARPVVLVRSDLDALPVREETGLPFASEAEATDREGKRVGVMHACGHDVHMTCLVGTARWLNDHRDRWSGTVVLIGQPAEEAVSGAKAMLADGLYRRFPRPDKALALHVTNDEPSDVVTYTMGPAFASSTSVDVTIRGRGGHGAAPHLTVDPIVLSALVILDLQTIVSREVDPVQPAVVTVGSIHGGSKHNIISDAVALQLTLRAYDEDVRDQLIEGIKRRIKGLALAHKAPEPSFAIAETTPPTLNTPELVTSVLPALKRELGDAKVREVPPVMGAEDFGLFSSGGVPTFMFRVGTVPPERFEAALEKDEKLPSLHSSKFAPDAPTSVRTGIRAMTSAVVSLLPPAPSRSR